MTQEKGFPAVELKTGEERRLSEKRGKFYLKALPEPFFSLLLFHFFTC